MRFNFTDIRRARSVFSLLIGFLLVSCYPLVNSKSMVDVDSGSNKLVEGVGFTTDLTTEPQTISRTFRPKKGGQYAVRYFFTLKNSELLPDELRWGYDVPKSVMATIEILDSEGNMLVHGKIENPGAGGGNGMDTFLFDTSEVGKNKNLIFRVSNLKIGADDVEPPSEIRMYVYRRNYAIWGR